MKYLINTERLSKILITYCLALGIGIVFFGFSELVYAATDSHHEFYDTHDDGGEKAQTFYNRWLGDNGYQIWSYEVYSEAHGHGFLLDSRAELETCILSYDRGLQDCIVVRSDKLGDSGQNFRFAEHSWGAGSNWTERFREVYVRQWVDDARLATDVTAHGRRISDVWIDVDRSSIKVGESFGVSFGTDEGHHGNNNVFSHGGAPISCGWPSGKSNLGGAGSTTCTAEGLGVAQVRMDATGPSAGGPLTITDTDEITITAPPAPEADLRCNNSGGSCTIDYNTSATIEWCGSDAHPCRDAASCEVSFSGGSWGGTSGRQSTGNLTSDRRYTLTCDNGYDDTSSDIVDVNVNPPPVENLRVRPRGSGRGTVNSSPSGINSCRTDGDSRCSADFDRSVTVRLTADPDPDTVITNWRLDWSETNGGTPVCGTSSTCDVRMDDDHSIMVQFHNLYDLSVNSDGVSNVPIDSSTGYDGTTNYIAPDIVHDTDVSLTAPAKHQSANFNGWSGCDSTSGSGNRTCNIDMQNDRTAAVEYNFPRPETDIRCDNGNGPCEIDFDETSQIEWCGPAHQPCADATSCFATINGSSWQTGLSGDFNENPGVGTWDYRLSCTGPGGDRDDTVRLVVNAPAPNNPSNVTVSQPDYCLVGPAATTTWDYSDPSGSPQSAYQVQVDDNSNFSSPEWDSDKIPCEGCRSNSTPQGFLQFNETYRARVRVWNGYDIVSGWTTSSDFTTPPHAFPDVDFSFQPVAEGQQQIIPNDPVQFTDQTDCYDINNQSITCSSWFWDFDDGGFSSEKDPVHSFASEGVYDVTETATDDAGNSCSLTQPVSVQEPNPIWIEVNPGG